LDLKIIDLVNGHLIGKGHIGLPELLLRMLISMKLWREKNIAELLMENIL
jgi:hypothetical protein